MADYRLGSIGDEVRQIETALRQQGLYAGPIDGIFGGGTEAAVRAFQRRSGLAVDGIVGPGTWNALFNVQAPAMPAPALAAAPIAERCLALTGAFETSLPPPDCFAGIAGDFDGMGLSYGALQWNLGQNTLQPILREFDAANAGVINDIFGSRAAELRAALGAPTLEEQLDWARSIQTPRFAVIEPWLGYFKTLGRNAAFIAAETAAAGRVMTQARGHLVAFTLRSQRGLALMFDIVTQNGGFPAAVTAAIRQDFAALPAGLSADEAEQKKLEIIANRRADAARAPFREDVRRRKLTIAQGKGEVHGRFYDLAGQFGITLANAT